MAENKLLKNEEYKFFSNRVGLIDTSNIILDCGVENYKALIQYLKSFNPKAIIQIIDAKTPYIIREKFGQKVFNELMELINKHKIIRLAPAKTESDLFLIQAALDNPEHFLLSNDKYADYDPKYTRHLKTIKFMCINSNFYFSLDLKSPPNKNKLKNPKNTSIIKQSTPEKERGVA